MIGIRRMIVWIVMAGFLILPGQLLAAEPESPPTDAVDTVQTEAPDTAKAGDADAADAEVDAGPTIDELEARVANLEATKANLETKLKASNAELEQNARDLRETSQQTEPPNRFLSGLGHSVAGGLGGFVLGIAGLLISAPFCPRNTSCNIIVAGAGYAIGAPLAAWKSGEWLGWDGSLLSTFAGAAVISAALVAASFNDTFFEHFLARTAVVGLPVVSTVAYQLSADWPTTSGPVAVPKVTSIPLVYFEF